jgi:hypothetical protein
MTTEKGRRAMTTDGLKVFVYFNLHRKLWSIKALEGPMKGRVIDHQRQVYLERCTFKVSEAGRQRVLRERKKNVHAGVVGYLSSTKANHIVPPGGFSIPIVYNPYKYDRFMAVFFFRKDDSVVPVLYAGEVFMYSSKESGGHVRGKDVVLNKTN